MVGQQAELAIGNGRTPRCYGQNDCKFGCPTVTIPLLSGVQSLWQQSVFSVCGANVDTKLISVDHLASSRSGNTHQPGSRPKQSSSNTVALRKCVVRHRQRDFVGVPETAECVTHDILIENHYVRRLVCNKYDALEIRCLRPNKLEHNKQEKVLFTNTNDLTCSPPCGKE